MIFEADGESRRLNYKVRVGDNECNPLFCNNFKKNKKFAKNA